MFATLFGRISPCASKATKATAGLLQRIGAISVGSPVAGESNSANHAEIAFQRRASPSLRYCFTFTSAFASRSNVAPHTTTATRAHTAAVTLLTRLLRLSTSFPHALPPRTPAAARAPADAVVHEELGAALHGQYDLVEMAVGLPVAGPLSVNHCCMNWMRNFAPAKGGRGCSVAVGARSSPPPLPRALPGPTRQETST
jgi:hypothetical protein